MDHNSSVLRVSIRSWNNLIDQYVQVDLSDENMYVYYIDNEQISFHPTLIFGLREFTLEEFEDVCSKNSTKNLSIRNDHANFTSNYYLRVYTSGCYYLDQHNSWQSDGLRVRFHHSYIKIRKRLLDLRLDPKQI